MLFNMTLRALKSAMGDLKKVGCHGIAGQRVRKTEFSNARKSKKKPSILSNDMLVFFDMI